jgi:hypothetical protein
MCSQAAARHSLRPLTLDFPNLCCNGTSLALYATPEFSEKRVEGKIMKKFTKMLAATVLLTGIAGTANATFVGYSWSDLYDPNPDLLVPPSRTYTHDLTHVDANDGGGEAFRPLTDLIGTFSLSVNLIDDASDSWFSAGEWALVNVPGVGGDNIFWNVSGTEFGGWSLAGWLQLNLTGTYTITIESLYGDFLFAASRLDAAGYRAVPEPGTLALLALGLIGIGVALSRRRKQNNNNENNNNQK